MRPHIFSAAIRLALPCCLVALVPSISLAQGTAATPPQKEPPVRATSATARRGAEASMQELPVHEVVLYKNGVGYFEHRGTVSGNERVSIDFTSSQLNDVLQSLTVLDEGGGHIAGVNYNSTTPLAEQLKSLSLGMSDDPTSTELFQALRGQRVEVSGAPGGAITGRLMSIESRGSSPGPISSADDATTPTPDSKAQSRYYLTVIGLSGAVRVIELMPALSIRPLDASLQGQLDRYLELLSTSRANGLRHLTLNALGSGQRQLRVSYISEVPVWKSTYRIVFPRATEDSAILQGWAVVDNTIGVDWDNVQLSLVAGSPQSFIQPLSDPLYLRRPEVPISTTAMTTPQTHEAANMQEVPAPAAVPSRVPISPGISRGLGGGRGSSAMGVASQSVSVSADAINASDTGAGYAPGLGGNMSGGIYRTSDAIAEGDVSTNAFDDFFEYSLAQPVTIHKNESAMVPILQEKLPAQRVTLWSESEPTPFRAIWLENTSKLTFDNGNFSVFESGAFAGEGLVDPIHPGEKRLLSYAADQAVRVRLEGNTGRRVLRQVSLIKGGAVFRRFGVQSTRNYLASNSADQARTVVIELSRRPGRKLSPETKAAETTPTHYRFSLAVPAHQSAGTSVSDEGSEDENWVISAYEDQTARLAELAKETPSLASAIQPIVEAQKQIADLNGQLKQLGEAVTTLTADEARTRDNLTALKGNDAARRFVDQLNHIEDQLDAVRKQIADVTDKKKATTESLTRLLQALEASWTSPGV